MTSSLRNYIRSNIHRLRSSPTLLISSSPPPAISTSVSGIKSPNNSLYDDLTSQKTNTLKFQQQQNNKTIHTFIERNIQSIKLEHNLKSIQTTISSAYPTLHDVNEAVDLAKRAGLGSGGVVIVIGSGAAIDLAKAVNDTLFEKNINSDDHTKENNESLVLAPCTLSGLWAATSNSPSIILDTKEEMLLPHLSTSSWNDVDAIRRETIVTLDDSKLWDLPPLYTPFQPIKRSEYTCSPSLAHVAAAILVVLLDVCRSLDVYIKATDWDKKENDAPSKVKHDLLRDIMLISLVCGGIIELAAQEAKGIVQEDRDDEQVYQQEIMNQLPRLSNIIHQVSKITKQPITATGTLPQQLANALLPQYFPQTHLITYLASMLPAMCDTFSTSNKDVSVRKEVEESILTISELESSSLAAWASEVTNDAGIPNMAMLAYGTPDMKTLVGTLDSYETLMTSLSGGNSSLIGDSKHDDHDIMEVVLQSSLHR